MRRGSGIGLAGLALASTFGFGLALYQTLSGDYVGGEVGFVWTITAVAGAIALGFWAVTVRLWSGDENRGRILGITVVGFLLALVMGVGVGFVTEAEPDQTVGTTAPTSDSD